MEGFLKVSTQVTVTVLMVDSSDHVTGKTGLSAGITKYLTKVGGTPTSATMTTSELDSTNAKGLYSLVFTTSHTDTLGEFQLHLTATGADPTDLKWQVSTYLPGEAATLQADQAVNTTKVGGTTQTARDLGASVLLSSGTGTGQLDFTSGVVKANLAQILGTALTETAGLLAGGFKKFFNIATPAATMDHLILVDTATTASALTTNNDKTGYSLAADQAVNVTKFNGTTVTARDIGASVLLSNGTGTGQVKLASGYVAPNWGDVGNPTTTVNLSATFIQGVNSLAAGSDSISTVATSGSTLTTGSATSGTYASTKEQDSVYWQIADATGTMDMYFEFNVGSLGVPTTAVWVGGLTTAVDSLKVFAYNWSGSAWEQVGLLNGTSSLIVNEQEYNFTTAHVGTGGNLGLVRLRFQNTGLVSANFYTDRVLCSYTNVYSFPSNFASMVIDGSGRVDVSKVSGTSQTAADIPARLGAPAGASMSADIAAVKVDTAAIKTTTDKFVFTIANKVDSSIQAAGDFAQAAADKVWSTAARLLTAGTNIVLAKGTGVTGFTDLDGAGVRTATGLASANLDTQLAAIDTDVLTRLATSGYTVPPTTAAIADKILGRNLAGGADGTRTVRDAFRLLRNKTSVAGSTLTVTEEDDSTTAWTAAVVTTAGNPISSVDPT